MEAKSSDRNGIHVINPNIAETFHHPHMSSEQSTVYNQASRVRSALKYIPHIEDQREYRLWEYGISEELVMNDIFHPFLDILMEQ